MAHIVVKAKEVTAYQNDKGSCPEEDPMILLKVDPNVGGVRYGG